MRTNPLAWAIGFAVGSLLAFGAFYGAKYLLRPWWAK